MLLENLDSTNSTSFSNSKNLNKIKIEQVESRIKLIIYTLVKMDILI